GHVEAEGKLLDAFRSGRIPHAWLIGGPPGVGKATLAYRMARFVLANPDPRAPAVQAARSLDVAPDRPAARRVAAQSHTDRLMLRPLAEDEVARAAATALERPEDGAEIRDAARAAQGSAGRAITLLGGRTLAVRERVVELLGRLPALDPSAMHALGDALGRANDAALEACLDAMRDWLSSRLS